MSIDSDQYLKVRNNVGLFDATHSFGRLFARGKDAIDLLHRMSTNDVKPLEASKPQAILTALLNEKGRLIDVVKVVRDNAGEILLITSKDKEQTVSAWLDKFTIMEDARFVNATEMVSQFEIVGPKAASLMQAYSEDAMDGVDVWGVQIAEVRAIIWKVSNSRYSILTLKENAQAVWNALKKDVLATEGSIIDDTLSEILRIEEGIPIAPNEINEKHNPLELPIASEAISFTKGCYIGQEVIARLDAQDKVQRKMMGLKFSGEGAAPGDRLAMEGIDSPLGNEVGDVTSVANSPKYGFIGLGYVRGKYANAGQRVRAGSEDAIIVDLPFAP